jgi:hypothetical protein
MILDKLSYTPANAEIDDAALNSSKFRSALAKINDKDMKIRPFEST